MNAHGNRITSRRNDVLVHRGAVIIWALLLVGLYCKTYHNVMLFIITGALVTVLFWLLVFATGRMTDEDVIWIVGVALGGFIGGGVTGRFFHGANDVVRGTVEGTCALLGVIVCYGALRLAKRTQLSGDRQNPRDVQGE